MKKVKTYIEDLDYLLNGGIPERNIVLLSGGPGTGKTIFSQQFIWNGLINGEGGVYVALEEHPFQIKQNMLQFNWDIKKFEKEGSFALVDAFTSGVGKYTRFEKYVVQDITNLKEFLETIKQAILETNAKRVVIDSVTTLYINKPSVARTIILQLKKVLSGLGVTSIFVSQISVGEIGFGGYGVEHGVDGIIRLDMDEIDGELKRSLIIWKMRGTKHSLKRHLMEIGDKGIRVYKDKIVKKRKIIEI